MRALKERYLQRRNDCYTNVYSNQYARKDREKRKRLVSEGIVQFKDTGSVYFNVYYRDEFVSCLFKYDNEDKRGFTKWFWRAVFSAEEARRNYVRKRT